MRFLIIYDSPQSMDTFNLSESLSRFAVAFVPVLLGIILHEVAHGWAAFKRGDPTAYMLGRLTMNPLPHIDPVGTAMFVFTTLFSPFVFGWARPVPINPRNFRTPRKDTLIVSAAGPLSNIALALIFAVCLRLLLFAPADVLTSTAAGNYFLQMFQIGIVANFSLAWINLLPIPPLDGGHIVESLLPYQAARQYMALSRYGFILLVVLIASGVLNNILTPLIRWSWQFALWLVGI